MGRMSWLTLLGLAGCAAMGQGVPPLEEAYRKYAHDTIPKPLPDLLLLGIPPEVRDQAGAALGRVDVTQPPFSADPSGQRDATRALQAAIDFARDHQMVCFFPPGTYLISDTLQCIQNLYRRTNGRVFGGNRFPNLLVGSAAGPARPKILLAPRSPGFGARPSRKRWSTSGLGATSTPPPRAGSVTGSAPRPNSPTSR